MNIASLIPGYELFTEPWKGERRVRADDLDGLVDGNCLPLPVAGETVLGRWKATKGKLLAWNEAMSDALEIEGELALLVTTKALRGSVINGESNKYGTLWAGLNAFRNKRARTVLFVWNYSHIDQIDTVAGIGTHKTIQVGYKSTSRLFSWETEAAKENWLTKGIGYRNRSNELAEQLARGVAAYHGVDLVWDEAGNGLSKERVVRFPDVEG